LADSLERVREAFAGRYAVERAVGEGGMATVYLARDEKHERAVAIKVLKPELAASIGAERFLREIKLAAQLQHPNILALYDSGEADGLVYYVMPFVEGESLRDRLDREKQLPIDEAIRLTLEVADALHCAHASGVVHRDIKPDNVLLLKASGHALVMDFGIARAVTAAGGDKLTQTGMAVGTPHYMSPEQATGQEHVDGRSDLYSLACVLYEMLAGQPPFDGPNALAILARHAMEAVPSLQIVRATVPDEVEEIVFTALAKTPADRYQTVQAFAEALASADLGMVSSRTTARAIPRRTMQHRLPTQQVEAVGAPPKRRGLHYGGVAAAVLAAAGVGVFLLRGGAGAAPAAAGPDSRRVAVLYFEDRSGGELGFLADGITEDLIRDLTGVRGLELVSRNGVAQFRGSGASRDSIARALRAGTLVAGSVEPAGGDRIRVNIQLADASGADFKRGSFEQAAGDPLAIRDSLASRVATFLRERLGEEIRVREQLASTRNPEAWSLVQRAEVARKAWQAGASAGDTSAVLAARFSEADSLFAQAAQRDRRWSTPWVGRAQLAYGRSRLAAGAPLEVKPWIERGLALADSAVAHDAADPDALEIRGTLRYWGYIQRIAPDDATAARDLERARNDLEQATKLSPTQAGAWATLSHLYYQVEDGRTTDALIAAQRAYEADTYLATANLVLERLFNASYDLGQLTDAQRWCAEGGRRFPADPRFQVCRLWLMTMKGAKPDVAEGWRIVDSGNVVVPGRGSEELQVRRARLALATGIARAGLADSARSVARSAARADADVDPARELALNLAFALATAGDRPGAVEALKVYFAANPSARRGLAEDSGWWFRDMEGDPAFRSLFAAR